MRPCEGYEVWISAFLDGELSGEERTELMAHMTDCRRCQQYFNDLVAIHDALDREEAPVPEGFADRVMARVRETEQERPQKTISFPHWRQWTALAACCALALLGLWSFRSAKGDRAAQDISLASIPYMAEDADITAADDEKGEPDGPAAAPAKADTQRSAAADEPMPQPEPQGASKSAPELPEAAAAPPAEDNVAVCEQYDRDILSQGILSAGGEAARRWVEEELGQTWESGHLYELTEEEHAGLLAALTEAEEDFRQEPGEGFWLLAEQAGE